VPIDWKPHTTPPTARRDYVLLAYSPELGVDNGYIGRVFEVCNGVVRCEQTGTEPRPPYYWCYEHEVLAGIPGVKICHHK